MKAERAYPRFTITAKGTRWVEGGHPWIYAQEIVSAPEGVEDGALVDAVSEKGKYLGSGFFSRESKIRIRLALPQRERPLRRGLLAPPHPLRLGLPQDGHGRGRFRAAASSSARRTASPG